MPWVATACAVGSTGRGWPVSITPTGVVTGGGGHENFATPTSRIPINPHVRRPDLRLCTHVHVPPSRRGGRRGLRLDVSCAAYIRRWSSLACNLATSTITSSSAAEPAFAPRHRYNARPLATVHTHPMPPTIVPPYSVSLPSSAGGKRRDTASSSPSADTRDVISQSIRSWSSSVTASSVLRSVWPKSLPSSGTSNSQTPSNSIPASFYSSYRYR